jgi:hypothetical protein
MKIHRVAHEPAGTAYERFVRAMVASQAMFSLVGRQDGGPPTERAWAVRTHLAKLEVACFLTNRWPGNRLTGRGAWATVVRFRCGDEAIPILTEPGALFSWRPPKYPEDLAFYASDGTCTFASVAHEGDAWVLRKEVARHLGQIVRLEIDEASGEDLRILWGAA